MYQANFWHMILKMLYYIPNFYTTDLNELAVCINHSFEIMLAKELEKKEKFNDYFDIIKRYIRRNDDIEITLMELDIFKAMLLRLYKSDVSLDKLPCLNTHILMLLAATENLINVLESCDYKSIFAKKLYLKHN